MILIKFLFWLKDFIRRRGKSPNVYLNGDLSIGDYQIKQFNKIFQHAYHTVPFYREWYAKQGINANFTINTLSDVRKLPVLTKDKVQKAVNDKSIFSSAYKIAELVQANTTGSSGNPLCVYVEKDVIIKNEVACNRLWRAMGVVPQRKAVKIWRRKPLTANEKRRILLGMTKVVAVEDFFVEPEKTVREIVAFKPEVIHGYSSVLFEIANIALNSQLKFSALKSVIGAAELLTDAMKKKMQKAFSCRIYDVYGSTEMPAIAATVQPSQKNHHLITEDLYLVELLDKNYQPVKKNEMGFITITDLHKKAMPFIRYQIGDLAASADNFYFHDAKQAFSSFSSLIGREDDIIELLNNKTIYPSFFFIEIRDETWINQFQIVQLSLNKISIHLAINENFSKQKLSKLQKKISSKLEGVVLEWRTTDKIKRNAGGKIKNIFKHKSMLK